MMQARAAASFERGPPRLMDNSLLRPRSIFPFPIALHTQPTTLPLFNVFYDPEIGRNETFLLDVNVFLFVIVFALICEVQNFCWKGARRTSGP